MGMRIKKLIKGLENSVLGRSEKVANMKAQSTKGLVMLKELEGRTYGWVSAEVMHGSR